MNDQEVSILKQSPGADPKVKRNSGLFSFFRWFRSGSRESVGSDLQNSTSGSSESVNSTGTAASFSFIPPTVYIKNTASDSSKSITPGPETDTYKNRLKQRDRIREKDRNITLRKKYNLFFNRDTLLRPKIEEDNSKSLPLMTKKMEEDERGHRRTNSDSSKTKKAGAYLHVKGKRKAPQPPKNHEGNNTLSLRRKKRLAPQPPMVSTERVINTLLQADDQMEYADTDVLFNDSLRLDNGVLKPAKVPGTQNLAAARNSASVLETPVSPRPWYKRNSSKDSSSKKENKYEPVENVNLKYNKDPKIERKEEKRKSGMMFLTNISELDREASEIIKEGQRNVNVLAEMPEFMRPKEEINTETTPKRKSAKDLIAKFNAITNVTKVTVNTAFFGAKEQKDRRDYFGKSDKNKENSPVTGRSFTPLMKSETSACIIKSGTPKNEKKNWRCTKCNSENDYWRIICHVCSNIKSYFDDLTPTAPKNNSNPIEKKAAENGAIKNTSAGVNLYNSKNTPDTAEVVTATSNPLERSRTQIGFANLKKVETKIDEREKLKKMLIDMKNSLPKRRLNGSAHLNRKSTIEEDTDELYEKQFNEIVHENILFTKKDKSFVNKSEDLNVNLNKDDPKMEEINKKIELKEEEVKQIKPIKVSSSVQTGALIKKTNVEQPRNFQLMRPKDFEDIYGEKAGQQTTHLYANLAQSENLFLNVPKRISELKGNLAETNNADTLEINRLLRRLENAIAKGDLTNAAVFARDLAQLKVNCSVIRQKSENLLNTPQNGFTVEMYVEDRLSHRGPFPIQITETQTVLELKKQVEREFEIPVAVQRWILGKELANKDTSMLKEHNILKTGCPIFLYLVAPTNQSNDENQPGREIPSTSNPPRIVEEKFKPIEKISDEKSKQILKLTEKAQNVSPKLQNKQTKSNIPVIKLNKEKEPPKAQPEDFTEYDKTLKLDKNSWACHLCTLINPITTNTCLVCASIRIKQKKGLKTPKVDNQHYLELMQLDTSDLVLNVESFECLVCLSDIKNKEGVTLRECLHQFCKSCLANTIEYSDEAQVKCPYRDNQYSCDIPLQDREIKALVPSAVYDQYLAKSVKQAENKTNKSFHCKTPDCKGWCIFEDNVNDFQCPVCRKTNCLTCQAIHVGLNCKQYQEQMNAQSETDEDAKQTREMLKQMVDKGEALTCPACQVILMKKWGCDWVRCSMCKTEICWVTRGLRWGPGGKGDTSGGCKCGVNGTKCHPQCNYCH